MLPQHQIEQTLLPPLQQLEQERKEVLSQLQIATVQSVVGAAVVLIIGFLIFLVTSQVSNGSFIFVFIITLIITPTLLYIIHSQFQTKTKQLQQQFAGKVKIEVYQQVFKTWKENSIYMPKKKVPPALFKKSGLYDYFDNYQGDDYVQGKLEDGRTFQFSELLVRRKVNSNKQEQDNYETIFKGLFFVLEGPHVLQNLLNPTVIKPRRQDEYHKKQQQQRKKQLSQSKTAAHKEDILDADFSAALSSKKETENSLFDQLFTIVSPEQWTVRRKLSQDFYDHLTHLRAQLRQQITMSFQKEAIYIGVNHQFDFWVVNVKESLVSPQRLRYLAWNFSVAFELLERLAEGTTTE